MPERPDRIEKEIEEILAKLDLGDDGDTITGERPREPISLDDRRRQEKRRPPRPGMGSRMADSMAFPSVAVTPAGLLFAGAGTMVGGLILASFWSPMIWLSFAGVLLFILAFGWSFMRRNGPNRGAGVGAPKQKYWRGRYIEVDPQEATTMQRFKRLFRPRR